MSKLVAKSTNKKFLSKALFKKSSPRIFRHGDILLREIGKLPGKAKPIRNKILAKGEKTGHHHRLTGSFKIYEMQDGSKQTRYLETFEETTLSHEEHNSIIIPKGIYTVVNERQYDPFPKAKVKEITASD